MSRPTTSQDVWEPPYEGDVSVPPSTGAAPPIPSALRRRFDPTSPVDQRVVRAEDVVAAATRGQALELHHALIIGPVLLRGLAVRAELRLYDCAFDSLVDLSNAYVERSIRVQRCEFRALASFVGSVFAGDVSLEGSRFLRPRHSSRPTTDHDTVGIAYLNDARFHGILAADGLEVAVGVRLSLARSRFGGELFLRGARFGSGLQLDGCEVDADVYVDGAAVRGTTSASRLRGGGSIYLRSCRFDGEVDASEIRVAGTLDLTQTEVQAGSLDLARSRVGRDLVADSLSTEGAIELSGTTVTGSLLLDGSRGQALRADALRVRGLTRLKGARVEEDVQLVGAELAGLSLVELECRRLLMKRAHLTGEMLAGRARFGGEGTAVELRGASVEDALSFDGVELLGSLDAKDVQVGASFSLTGCRVGGDLEFRGARLGKHLFARGAEVAGALDLSEAEVSGEIFLSGASFDERASFAGATIGTLVLTGEQDTDDSGSVVPWPPPKFAQGLDLQGLRVRGSVVIIGVKTGARDVPSIAKEAFAIDLTSARIDGELVLRHISASAPLRLDAATVLGPVRAEGIQGALQAARSELASGFSLGLVGLRTPTGGLDLDLSNTRVGGVLALEGLGEREEVELSLHGVTCRRVVFPAQVGGHARVELGEFRAREPAENWEWLAGGRVSVKDAYDVGFERLVRQLSDTGQARAAAQLRRARDRSSRRMLRERGESLAYLVRAIRGVVVPAGAFPWLASLVTVGLFGLACWTFGQPGTVFYAGTTEVAALTTTQAVGLAFDLLVPVSTPLSEGLSLSTTGLPSPSWVGGGLSVAGWCWAIGLALHWFRHWFRRR